MVRKSLLIAFACGVLLTGCATDTTKGQTSMVPASAPVIQAEQPEKRTVFTAPPTAASPSPVPLASVGILGGPDAVAVVIGNRNYSKPHVPTVEYAQRDANAFDRMLTDVMGVRKENVIDLRDASQAEMEAILGNDRTHQGRLWQLVKDRSDVLVFYSGHGSPGRQDKRGYLLPVDADPEKPELNGLPIDIVLANLASLHARTTTVFLDACFSGDTPRGSLITGASGIYIVPLQPKTPHGVLVLTAGQADQIASWDSKTRHGLFTESLLDALYGKADRPPYGNGDGKVQVREVKAYLDDVMSGAARREYGRTQTASLVGDDRQTLVNLPQGRPVVRQDISDPVPPPVEPPIAKAPPKTQGLSDETVFWSSIKDSRKASDFEAYLRRFPDGTFVDLARSRIADLRSPPPVPQPPPLATPQPAPLPVPVQPAPQPVYAAPRPVVSGQVLFTSDYAARATCPGDIVVWVNMETMVYHYPGKRWYGRTKNGAYMCETQRGAVGARPAANGQ